jgi:hypothetical protein
LPNTRIYAFYIDFFLLKSEQHISQQHKARSPLIPLRRVRPPFHMQQINKIKSKFGVVRGQNHQINKIKSKFAVVRGQNHQINKIKSKFGVIRGQNHTWMKIAQRSFGHLEVGDAEFCCKQKVLWKVGNTVRGMGQFIWCF